MKKNRLFLTVIITSLSLCAQAQTGGGGASGGGSAAGSGGTSSSGGTGGSTGNGTSAATANSGTSANSGANAQGNNNALAPATPANPVNPNISPQSGGPNRFQTGAPPRFVMTNSFNLATNQNQFGVTNQFGTTNQLGVDTNGLFGGDTNGFAATNFFGTNFLGGTNSFGLTNGSQIVFQDIAITDFDRSLLIRIRQAIVTPSQGTGAPFNPASVGFQLNNGVVTAVGMVPTTGEKQRVLTVAQRVPGVVRVIDQMAVNPQAALMNRQNSSATNLSPTGPGNSSVFAGTNQSGGAGFFFPGQFRTNSRLRGSIPATTNTINPTQQ